MAKVVFESSPKSAYEIAVVKGGDTMKDYERAALLDDFINDNGLVPVETSFVGEVPTHRYGRYKAETASIASALAPLSTGSTDDVAKLRKEKSDMENEMARLRAQLETKNAAKGNSDEVAPTDTIGSASTSTTDDAREALNQTDGVDLVGSGEEVREDMGTADRSDDNPKVDAPRRGRPPKDAN